MFIDRGSGPPLVFLPGFTGSGQSFHAQVEEFSTSFRVLAWSLPGSDGRAIPDVMTIGGLVSALRRQLADVGVESAFWVGHAVGGMIVQELAVRAPKMVDAAVLYATSPSLGDAGGDWQQAFRAQRLAPLDAGLHMSDLAPALITELVSPYASPEGVRKAVQLLSLVPPNFYRRLIDAATGFDRRTELASMTMPILCLTGEAERTAPPAMMEQLANRLPDGRFALIRRAGHEAHLEQPQAFNGLLGAFLHDLRQAA